MAAYSPVSRNLEYQNTMYSRRQMRDTIEGANAVKNSNEMYLPIPSSWLDLDLTSAPSQTRRVDPSNSHNLSPDYIPWKHHNPIYQAYLQRARFPDITASSLRGMLGLATKIEPEINLPSNMDALIDEVSYGGESLMEFYAYCLSEVLAVGKVAIIVDVDDDNNFCLTTYSAEANINWKTKRSKGVLELKAASFVEDEDNEVTDGEEASIKEFCFNEDGVPVSRDYEDSKLVDGSEVELKYMGKTFHKLPIFFAGAMENTPNPKTIPLIGVSDIAISVYQEVADLRQAHFMTCNPTLFVFGVGEKETPKVVGSNVIIGIRNPQGNALYPATDTTALEHIRTYIDDLLAEAAGYGASFVSNGRQKESGEALGYKQANRGANLVHCVRQTGKAIQDALRFIAELKGKDKEEVVFDPATEFAEMQLTAQDITSLVSAWVQGGIDHDMLLNNLRDAGYEKGDRTNEQIKASINNAPPAVKDGDGNAEDDEPEEEENEEEENENEEDAQ